MIGSNPDLSFGLWENGLLDVTCETPGRTGVKPDLSLPGDFVGRTGVNPDLLGVLFWGGGLLQPLIATTFFLVEPAGSSVSLRDDDEVNPLFKNVVFLFPA